MSGKVKCVELTWRNEPANEFLRAFNDAIKMAVSLRMGVSITVVDAADDIKVLSHLFAHPAARRIQILKWTHSGDGDVFSVRALLLSGCPNLDSLEVHFAQHSVQDFLTGIFEQPNRIKQTSIPADGDEGADINELFGNMRRSRVTHLTIYGNVSDDFFDAWCQFVESDTIHELTLVGDVSHELAATLAGCEKMKVLKVMKSVIRAPDLLAEYGLPSNLFELAFHDCTFPDGFDWSFLERSVAKRLIFNNETGVNGSVLGHALMLRLRNSPLELFRIQRCDFAREFAFAVGVELGQIKLLDLDDFYGSHVLNGSSIVQIALALQTPNCIMEGLSFACFDYLIPSVDAYLMPALLTPNCSLVRLKTNSLNPYGRASVVEREFRNRLALFALLQGQQVRRFYCPLRRLPVEMLRLTGMMLM